MSVLTGSGDQTAKLWDVHLEILRQTLSHRTPDRHDASTDRIPMIDSAHALVIGIADYNNVRKLPQVDDARDIAGLLTDPQYGGYPPDHVHLLLDGQATREA